VARIAALVAVDAPPLSYPANADAADDVGFTLEDVQGVLVAVALTAIRLSPGIGSFGIDSRA
jgi:hypothetical protein